MVNVVTIPTNINTNDTLTKESTPDNIQKYSTSHDYFQERQQSKLQALTEIKKYFHNNSSISSQNMVQETSRCNPYSANISKFDHRRKVLNEIREYFQTQKTLTLIKDVTTKMELKQNNIVSNVISCLNDVHTVIKQHTYQIIDLQHNMVTLK